MNRRNAFRSMIALAVAPALVKVEMLMPVKVVPDYGGKAIAMMQEGMTFIGTDYHKDEFNVEYLEKMRDKMNEPIKLNWNPAHGEAWWTMHPDVKRDLGL